MKSGSGNLGFGGGNPEDEGEATGEEEISSTTSADEPSHSGSADRTTSTPVETTPDYPYFVRRNNVGDEGDIRLEIHVRDTKN